MTVTQLHFEQRTDLPSLGDAAVVNRLVSEFTQAVIGVRNDFLAGRPGTEDAPGRIEALAKNAGDVIMGRNPDFHAMEWQNPVRLGSKIRFLCDEIAEYPDPGQAFFIWLSKQVIASMMAVEEQRCTPDEAGPRLRVVVDDVVDRILGVR